MLRHFDQRAIERAAVLLKVAHGYSGDELESALEAARSAVGYCLSEIDAAGERGRPLFDAIDAARSLVRNRA